jgi:hypothetical protein
LHKGEQPLFFHTHSKISNRTPEAKTRTWTDGWGLQTCDSGVGCLKGATSKLKKNLKGNDKG